MLIEQHNNYIESTLNADRFELWILITLLRAIRINEPNTYTVYLDTDYDEVIDVFIKLFLPNDPMQEKEDENNITTRYGTEEEQDFVISVKGKVEEIILASTFYLQSKLDQEEEKQIVTSMITAKYKRDDTVKATEATVLAIHDISPQGQSNMEQHIKNLIERALKEKEKEITPKTPSSNEKRKISTGGKKPQPWSPRNNGETSKKVSFRYPITNNEANKEEEDNEEEEEEQEQPNPKKQKLPTKRLQRNAFKEETPLSTKRKRQSRRKEERSKRRKKIKEEKLIQQQEYTLTKKPITDSISAISKECIRTYGFVANPNKPIWKNIPSALKSMNTNAYLQLPYNLHCHNLCENLQPPLGFNTLLGLGLNFCIEQNQPKPNVQNTLEKLKRSVQLKEWLKENSNNNNDDEYLPYLYLPTYWNPPPASDEIEINYKIFQLN
jgi:hypothetical protein